MYKLVAKRKGYYDAITFKVETQIEASTLLFDLLHTSTDEIEVKVSIVKENDGEESPEESCDEIGSSI